MALKRALLTEELFHLTGDDLAAVLLHQLVYWSLRVRDVDAYLDEERQRGRTVNVSSTAGWLYKTADQLREEVLTSRSRITVYRRLETLVERGWVARRRNPEDPVDATYQYRPDLNRIERDLRADGYTLATILGEHYPDIFQKADEEGAEQGGLAPKDNSISHHDTDLFHGDTDLFHSDNSTIIDYTETTTETTPSSAGAAEPVLKQPPVKSIGSPAEQLPRSFEEWARWIENSPARSRGLVLHRMCQILYLNHKPPEVGYLCKVAKQVGGARRLAALLWEASARPPAGDLLAYCRGIERAKREHNSRGTERVSAGRVPLRAPGDLTEDEIEMNRVAFLSLREVPDAAV